MLMWVDRAADTALLRVGIAGSTSTSTTGPPRSMWSVEAPSADGARRTDTADGAVLWRTNARSRPCGAYDAYDAYGVDEIDNISVPGPLAPTPGSRATISAPRRASKVCTSSDFHVP